MAIVAPGTITPSNVPRQTLPYGDRPLGYVREGAVYATNDFYQWLSRIAQGMGATVANVGTVVTTVNETSADITEIVAELGTIDEEIATLTAEVNSAAALATNPSPLFPPTLPPVSSQAVAAAPLYPPRPLPPPITPIAPAPVRGLGAAQAFGFAFFFGA